VHDQGAHLSDAGPDGRQGEVASQHLLLPTGQHRLQNTRLGVQQTHAFAEQGERGTGRLLLAMIRHDHDPFKIPRAGTLARSGLSI